MRERESSTKPGRMPAGRAIQVVLVALIVGLVLNSADILRTAERQAPGPVRTAALAVMRPLAAVSHTLLLDRPRQAVDTALGHAPPPTTVVEATGATTTTTSTTVAATVPEPPGPRPVSASDPLRMYVAGDSMVGQFGPMLERRAEASGVVTADVRYEFDSGLTRPDFIDWPALLRSVGFDLDPDVIVVFFGGNDAQDIRIDGRWEPYGTDAWLTEYRSRVDALMTQLVDQGSEVWWMGMPIVRSETFRAKVEMMNDVYRTEAARHPGVHFFDSWPLFTGADGEYSEYLEDADGNLVDMRLNDGVHLTTAGGIRLASAVWSQMSDEWGIDG